MSGLVGATSRLRRIASTGSTNADLIGRIAGGDPPPDGEWLLADRQTTGRGRRGRVWFDGTGNFMGSTAIRLLPGDPPPASLSLVAGIALHETVAALLPPAAGAMLKWPNDLMVGAAKLAGILLEREADWIVVGIGVNLAAAPDLPDRPSTALSAFGPAPDRDMFAANLARQLDQEAQRWRSYGLEPLTRRWMAAAHPVGTPLAVHPPGESVLEGRFDGLAEDGSLLLRMIDGATRTVSAGDVMLARKD